MSITLTISEGCLEPCDLANVVCITSPHGVVWLGQIELHLHYARLVDWAEAVARTDALFRCIQPVIVTVLIGFDLPRSGFRKNKRPVNYKISPWQAFAEQVPVVQSY